MEPAELNLVEVVLELSKDGKAVYAVSSTWTTLLSFQHSLTPTPSPVHPSALNLIGYFLKKAFHTFSEQARSPYFIYP